MDKEALKIIILETLNELSLSSQKCPYHTHTITDGGQLDASKSLVGTPQPTISAVAGVLSNGGSTALSTADSTILTNLQTALNALILANKNIGLIHK